MGADDLAHAVEYRGGYRVTSAMLGRDLTEDLGLMPDGIKDFGLADQPDETHEGKRTAVQIVMQYRDTTLPDAVEWLRGQLRLSKRVCVILGPSINKTLDDTENAMMLARVPIYQQGTRLVHIFRLGKDDAPDQPLRRKAGTLGIYAVGDLRILQYWDGTIAFYSRGDDGALHPSRQVRAAGLSHTSSSEPTFGNCVTSSASSSAQYSAAMVAIVAQGYDHATGQFLDSGDLIVADNSRTCDTG